MIEDLKFAACAALVACAIAIGAGVGLVGAVQVMIWAGVIV